MANLAYSGAKTVELGSRAISAALLVKTARDNIAISAYENRDYRADKNDTVELGYRRSNNARYIRFQGSKRLERIPES